MRVYRIQSTNPLIAVLVLLLVLAVLATVFVFGAVVLGGAAVLGAGAMAVRRMVRGRRPLPPPAPESLPLDPSREVFPDAPGSRRLPSP